MWVGVAGSCDFGFLGADTELCKLQLGLPVCSLLAPATVCSPRKEENIYLRG